MMDRFVTKGQLIELAKRHLLPDGSAVDSALPRASAEMILNKIHEWDRMSGTPPDPTKNHLFHFGWVYTPDCSFGRLYPLTREGRRFIEQHGEDLGFSLDSTWILTAQDVLDKEEDDEEDTVEGP